MAQKDRKTGKKRGSRSCGYGNAQKHRGAGSRGGRGNAGRGKHKQVKLHIEHPKYFGKKGFKRHPSIIKDQKVLNLSDIEHMLENWLKDGKAKKEKDIYIIDVTKLGFQKILGAGKISHAIHITAESFSKSAKGKIEKAGGKAVTKE